MTELFCDNCGVQIGWICDSGHRGYVECEDCYEETRQLEMDKLKEVESKDENSKE